MINIGKTEQSALIIKYSTKNHGKVHKVLVAVFVTFEKANVLFESSVANFLGVQFLPRKTEKLRNSFEMSYIWSKRIKIEQNSRNFQEKCLFPREISHYM